MLSINKAKQIKMMIFDVDGTLTDGAINIGNETEFFKSFNVKDGLGIHLAKKTGIITAIITGRKSEIVEKRAKELNIDELHQKIKVKSEIVKDLAAKYTLSLEEIAFMGDDLNDYMAMKIVGFSATPSDGGKEIKEISDFISSKKGGHGAAREVVEYILKVQGKWDSALSIFKS